MLLGPQTLTAVLPYDGCKKPGYVDDSACLLPTRTRQLEAGHREGGYAFISKSLEENEREKTLRLSFGSHFKVHFL